MDSFKILLFPLKGIPNNFNDLLIAHFIEYTIACQNNEILLGGHHHAAHFWLINNYIRVALELWEFGLNITECSSD